MTTPSNVQLPSAHDAKLAKASMKAFRHLKNDEVELRVEQETVRVPLTAVKLLQRILSQMAQGNAVTITPIKSEITTQAAADILNVSRPYLIGLLENKTIASRKVGTHRHVLAATIVGGASIIVTDNQKDFPIAALEAHGIMTQNADDFVLMLIDIDLDAVLLAVNTVQKRLRRPSVTMLEYLNRLEQLRLHKTVDALRKLL